MWLPIRGTEIKENALRFLVLMCSNATRVVVGNGKAR